MTDSNPDSPVLIARPDSATAPIVDAQRPIVMKFGGTSVADSERMRLIGERVR
ncbi:MAG: hypothetical protein HZB39_11810 [Planctomycetes bacterium]|nr:hypothetical protein [Planctomycetota bacterium]